MYLLKKIFQLRDHVNPENEKPFLEHLEDLRTMIMRMVVTLVLAMLVCFSFQEKLMEVLRLPVERVWMNQLLDKLPQGKDGSVRLDIETWERAKAVEHALSSLDRDSRAAFFQALGDDNLRFHAQAVGLLRAALALPKDKRDGFVAGLTVTEDMKTQVRALLKTAPSPEIDNRGNLRMMSALKPTETFMLSMKLSFFAGIVISFPLLLLFVLQFVLPGLHANEKRILWPALSIGFGLFLGGVLFAYAEVLPRALGFFYEWGGKLGVSNDWRIGEYITFATQFTLLFGLAFELPVVVMVLVKLGLLSYATMSRTRSYAILAIFVAAMILTPTPDALTMTLMAAPMVVLYEICIWLAWWDERKARRAEEKAAMDQKMAAPPPPAAETTTTPAASGTATEESSIPPTESSASDVESSASTAETSASSEAAPDDSWRKQYPDLIGLESNNITPSDALPNPEMPAVPYVPEPSKLPKGSKAAKAKAPAAKAPKTPKTPKTPKAPKAPKVPKALKSARETKVSKVAKASGKTKAAKSSAPKTPKTPAAAKPAVARKVPKTPAAAKAPAARKVPRARKAAKAPGQPEAPGRGDD